MARILLIYANPAITAIPVAPYGMEKIAQAFTLAGCEVIMKAPFIEDNPVDEMNGYLLEAWDLIGFSIRNIDDALVVRSEKGSGDIDLSFYLDAVKPLITLAISSLGPDRVLLGGTAISSGPLPVLQYLGARHAISGPADDLCWKIGVELKKGNGLILPSDPRVITNEGVLSKNHRTLGRKRGFGHNAVLLPAPASRMGPYLGLTMVRGGRVAVSLDAGCDRRCNFCVEARFLGYSIVNRDEQAILIEIEQLQQLGVQKFWLATSELNVPNDKKAISLLKKLAGKNLDLMGFLQVAPISYELLDAMEDAGMDPSSLSFEFGHLDGDLLRKGAGPANRKQIDELVEMWLRRGYDTLGGSVLLGAHPEENWDTIDSAIQSAKEIDAALPKGFGLAYATGARVYPETDLADWVADHWNAAVKDIYGEHDKSFVRPVVFCRPTSPRKLLGYVNRGLASAKGQMGPMNAEAPASEVMLSTEAFVNRAIWRLQEGKVSAAERCLKEALKLTPNHLEALAQLAQLQVNLLHDSQAARNTLLKLQESLPIGDHRREEVRCLLVNL
jgi:hypothetical protein